MGTEICTDDNAKSDTENKTNTMEEEEDALLLQHFIDELNHQADDHSMEHLQSAVVQQPELFPKELTRTGSQWRGSSSTS